jgi:outer membrane protein assembly factor BamB
MLTRLSFGLAICLFAITSFVSAQVPSGPSDWPQWRGPNRDGISLEKGLLKEWPQGGPKVLWQVDAVGAGYSSMAVKDGRVFTQGDLNGVEHVIALSVEDGRVLWAVQPEPVSARLAERLASELKQLDKNGDGVVDELEALARFGWDLNKYDQPAGGDSAALATARAEKLFAALDQNQDGKLSFAEAGNAFRDYFERMDIADTQADAAKLAAQRTAAYLKELDKDADGKVSRQESRGSAADRFFGRADERDATTQRGDDQLTAAEIEQYLVKSEAGRDGDISRDELQAFYAKSRVAGDGVLTVAELRGVYGGYRNGMGDGPRGTPTVDGDRVFAEGGNGDVTCLDAATGKTIWHVNLRDDFGGGVPGWGYSESPLIEGNLLIVTPGGKKGTVLALDKYTGGVVWQSSSVTEGAHYASPVAADIGGVRQIVTFARDSVFGVTANSGQFLWRYTAANNGTANCCTPIVFKDYVFASSGYGTGGGLAKITNDGDKQAAEEVYFEKKLASHHGGMTKVGDYIYCNGAGPLMCMDYLSGKTAWQSRSVGKGSLVVADGMLYLLSENHEVALAEVTPEEYREHGRFKIESHGRPSWAHPIVAGGRLYIRDQQSLTAYDVRAQ